MSAIEGLRELLAKYEPAASGCKYVWAEIAEAAVNALPALLDVAEAAKQADYALASVRALTSTDAATMNRDQYESLVAAMLTVRAALARLEMTT